MKKSSQKEVSKTLVTGSSGYVASILIPNINKHMEVFGIDVSENIHTDLKCDIAEDSLKSSLYHFKEKKLTIINLAASRFDFGASAKDYYKLNVLSHEKFLQSLSGFRIRKFIHVSSVAAFDGKNIPYSDSLNCDDAYRATKYLQEVKIQKYCSDNNIELTILYPSAIFSDDPRSDTNIGKLQSISRYIPFVPKIDVVKSLTYLPTFSKFIADLAAGEISAGKYLTIEKPSLTVSKIIQIISGQSIRLVHIPFLQLILRTIANFLYVISLFGKFDFIITPNRVVKLFSDTSYTQINYEDIDTETYTSRNCRQLTEILADFKKEKINA